MNIITELEEAIEGYHGGLSERITAIIENYRTPAAPVVAEGLASTALRKLCERLDGEKRRMRHTPGTGQDHSYMLCEDVDAYVEEARKALPPVAPNTTLLSKIEAAIPSLYGMWHKQLIANGAVMSDKSTPARCEECLGTGKCGPDEDPNEMDCEVCDGSGHQVAAHPVAGSPAEAESLADDGGFDDKLDEYFKARNASYEFDKGGEAERAAAKAKADLIAYIEARRTPAAPKPAEPKLVLALPDYDKRRIVIASDEVIDGERLVCVAIEEAPMPASEHYLILQNVHAEISKRRDAQPEYLREGMNKAINTVERIMLKFGKAEPMPASEAPEHADDLAWHKESLARHAAKLDAVWKDLAGMVEKFTGKPCSSEPLSDLTAILAAPMPASEAASQQSLPQSECNATLRAAPAGLLNADELAALQRFDECAQDGEGYDVPKDMMQRLAEIGVVQRRSGAYYQATVFGQQVLGNAIPAPSIKEMVNNFLGWRLPADFSPDCGIGFDGRKDDEWNKNKTWPIGTNLLNADQARAMFEYVLAPRFRAEGGITNGSTTNLAAPTAPTDAKAAPDLVDTFNTMMWLYRRLPRGYDRVPHVERTVTALAKAIGTDADEYLEERGEIDPPAAQSVRDAAQAPPLKEGSRFEERG